MSYLTILNKNKSKNRLFFDNLNEDVLGVIFNYIDVDSFKSILSFHQFNVLLNKPIYWINRLKMEYPGLPTSIINKKFGRYSLINSDVYQILKKDIPKYIKHINSYINIPIPGDLRERFNKHLIKNNKHIIIHFASSYHIDINQNVGLYFININTYINDQCVKIVIDNLTLYELMVEFFL